MKQKKNNPTIIFIMKFFKNNRERVPMNKKNQRENTKEIKTNE